MKKLFLAVIFATTVIGGVQAVNLMQHYDHQHNLETGNMRCGFCNGSGFSGQFNCSYCRGTGRNSAY